MIDAYTIGVTLALEDGVSEGILQIRRDLAALDAAVAESAARLVMLGKLAKDVGLAMPADRTAQSAALFSPSSTVVRTTPAPAAVNEAQVVAPGAPPTPSSISSLPIPQSPTPYVPPALKVAVPPPPPKDGPPYAHSRAPDSPLYQAPIAAAAATAMQSTVGPAIVVPTVIPAPVAPAVQSVSPRQELPPEPRTAPTEAFDFAAFARSLVPRALPAPAEPSPLSEHPDLTSEHSETPAPRTQAAPAVIQMPTPPSSWSQTPMPVAPATPTLTTHRPESRSPRATLSKPVQASLNAPTASRPSVSPIGPVPTMPARPPVFTGEPSRSPPAVVAGDEQKVDRPAFAELHLDGTTLGRWVTRHLEREVTRPQAGATGFDPRMTPSWAGAPIGN
jgi:hypothetical protein